MRMRDGSGATASLSDLPDEQKLSVIQPFEKAVSDNVLVFKGGVLYSCGVERPARDFRYDCPFNC